MSKLRLHTPMLKQPRIHSHEYVPDVSIRQERAREYANIVMHPEMADEIRAKTKKDEFGQSLSLKAQKVKKKEPVDVDHLLSKYSKPTPDQILDELIEAQRSKLIFEHGKLSTTKLF